MSTFAEQGQLIVGADTLGFDINLNQSFHNAFYFGFVRNDSDDTDFSTLISYDNGISNGRILPVFEFASSGGITYSLTIGDPDLLSGTFSDSVEPFEPAPVPEPSTALLLSIGLIGLGARRKRS